MKQENPTGGELQPLVDNILVVLFAGLSFGSLRGIEGFNEEGTPRQNMIELAINDAEALLEALKGRGYGDMVDVVRKMEGGAEEGPVDLTVTAEECKGLCRLVTAYGPRHKDLIDLLEAGVEGRGLKISKA